MFGDVHIDNKAYKNADITMTVRLSYTSLMLFNEKVMRECNRQSGRVSQPVNILLKVV